MTKREPKLKYIVQEVWKIQEAEDGDTFVKYSEFHTKSAAVQRALELAEDPEVLTAVIYRAHAVGASATTLDALAYLKTYADGNQDLMTQAGEYANREKN